MNYCLASGVHLIDQPAGGLLVRHHPMRAIRCNGRLWRLLSELQTASGTEHGFSVPVLETLADAGFLRRRWPKPAASECPSISIIIPVKDRAGELQRCLDSFATLNYPREKLEIIVVDDGSSDQSPAVARRHGATCLSSGGIGLGPAAARNKGAEAAHGVLLAFIDSDCTASADWLLELVAPFGDRQVGAVGGAVLGNLQVSRLDRYEHVMSSLYLGKNDRWGGEGNDTFYLPSCNLLVQRELFRAVGGFDPDMQVGEDVDLSYRLREAGFRIGYLPCGAVYHAHRNRLQSFMARRFAYGTSEALLTRRHPLRHKIMQLPLALLLALLLIPLTVWSPLWAGPILAAAMATDVLRQRKKLAILGSFPGIVKIFSGRLRSIFSLGYYQAYHILRYYLPLLLAVSLIFPSAATLFAAVFFLGSAVDYLVKKPGLGPLSFAGIYFCEQLSYSSGVFWGCLKQRSFACYSIKFNLLQSKSC